jgi:fructokinase
MFVVGGESLVDLVPSGKQTEGVIERLPYPGGSPYNCAIALSKLGNDTGFLCPISQDEFGDALLKPLAEAGVKVLLTERVVAPTTKAVVTFNEKMQASYDFQRGADHAFTRDQMIGALPQSVEVFQFGGFGPIEPEDAAVWIAVAKEAAARGAIISMDPNLRPSLISDFEGYKARLSACLDLAHLVKMSDEDLTALDASKSIEQHAAELLARPNCELVVITLGENGSRAFTKSAEAQAGIYAPPVFVDTVGAGDSLMAGIITTLAERGAMKPGELRLLDAEALKSVLQFGAIVAGLNCAKKGCNPPTRGEVDAVLYLPD